MIFSLVLMPFIGLTQRIGTPFNRLESAFPLKKLSVPLQQRLSTMSPTEEIEVEWLTDDLVKAKSTLDEMDKTYFHHSSFLPQRLIVVPLKRDEIFSIASLTCTVAMEWVRSPEVELKQEGLDLSSVVKYLHHQRPWLNGMAQVISIGEGPDTLMWISGNRHYATDLTAPHQNIHATAMASIIAGEAIHPSAFGSGRYHYRFSIMRVSCRIRTLISDNFIKVQIIPMAPV
jgi:hypothetical protein